MHYDPERSVFINLYDIYKADPMEHFSQLLALHHALSVPNISPTFGYCAIPDLIRYLCQLGFSEEHARFTTRHLFEKKCCESRDPIEEWSETIKEVRVTSLGKYHVSHLAHSFQYVDAVSVDTPILDDAVRAKVVDVFAIRERLDRAIVFIDYLNACSKVLSDSRAKQIWNDLYLTSKVAISGIAKATQGR